MLKYQRRWLVDVSLLSALALCIVKPCHGFPFSQVEHSESMVKGLISTNFTQSSLIAPELNDSQTYGFSYEINDQRTGTQQYRRERGFLNGTVQSSYGFASPDARLNVQHLTAIKMLEHQANESEHIQAVVKNATNATEIGPNININIDKDLLSPTLWGIVNGSALLNATKEKKEAENLGIATYEKVIPKQFPLITFHLPVDKPNPKDAIVTPKSMNAMMEHTANNTDWVSKIVNETRKEFLENVPISF